MRSRIVYIESKGEGLSGPARIGRVPFNRTGRTLYTETNRFRAPKGAASKPTIATPKPGRGIGFQVHVVMDWTLTTIDCQPAESRALPRQDLARPTRPRVSCCSRMSLEVPYAHAVISDLCFLHRSISRRDPLPTHFRPKPFYDSHSERAVQRRR